MSKLSQELHNNEVKLLAGILFLNNSYRLICTESKYENIQKIIKELIPETQFVKLEQEIFQHLLPVLADITISKSRICYSIISKSSDVENPQQLEETMNLIKDLLQAFDDLLTLIMEEKCVELCYIQSIPLHTASALFDTFLFCSDSQEFWDDSVDTIQEVFFKCKGVYEKFLKILNEHLKLNMFCDTNRQVLLDLLDFLIKFGNVLSKMNRKMLADTWKCYRVLAIKHSADLQDCFNIKDPFTFISDEIILHLTNIAVDYYDNEKDSTKVLKLCNFFIRIFVALANSFWYLCKTTPDVLLIVFNTLYSFSDLFKKDFDENLSKAINENVYNFIQPVLIKFLNDTTPFKDLDYKFSSNYIGIYIMTCLALPKLNYSMKSGTTFLHLQWLIQNFDKVSPSLITAQWKICGKSIYSQLLINFVPKILMIERDEYFQIEAMFAIHLFGGTTTQSTFVCDMWTLLMCQAPPSLCYDTIINVIDALKTYQVQQINQHPNFPLIKQFLSSSYNILPHTLQAKFIEKYQIEEYVNVWLMFDMRRLPTQKAFMYDAIIDNFCKKIDAICDVGTLQHKNFLFVSGCLNILATLEIPAGALSNHKKLSEALIRLWQMEHIREKDLLLNTKLYDNLLNGLYSLTLKLMNKLASTQVYQILAPIKHHVGRTTSLTLKINAMQLLDALVALEMDDKSAPHVEQILSIINSDKHQIVKKYSMVHNERFIQLAGKCKKLMSISPDMKRIRLENGPSSNNDATTVDVILSNMHNEVKTLRKFVVSGKLSQQHSTSLYDIVLKLQQML